MPYDLHDTIAAVASPPGGGPRGILRLSGPGVPSILASCLSSGPPATTARAVVFPSQVRLAGCAAPLDALVYLWPAGRSYTGQLSAEVHLPGSPPLLAAVLAALCRAGARLAAPGEFTLRAFLSGRLDLTQAEAIQAVIAAGEPTQLQAALAQLAGGLRRPLAALRETLAGLLADLEAGLDFDDHEVPALDPDHLAVQLTAVLADVQAVESQLSSRADWSESPRIVLCGPPNSGKSSLYNALAGAQALVSDQAGTTRDYLVAPLSIAGRMCLLVDTAGLDFPKSTDHPVSTAAQSQAQDQHHRADLRLECLDASRPESWPQPAPWTSPRVLLVVTKCDLGLPHHHPSGAVLTSARSGQGLDALRAALAQALMAGDSGPVAVPATAERCRESLAAAKKSLFQAVHLAQGRLGDELVAAELRLALDELGLVVGAVHTDELLDRIFSRFCIGK